jgi:hypothetical protein
MIITGSNDNTPKRPHRPEQIFLDNVQIAHLPDDTDIRFDDAPGYMTYTRDADGFASVSWNSRRAFYLTKVDEETGAAIQRVKIPAFETQTRTRKDIWADVHAALVREFGAVSSDPAEHETYRARRPTTDFLHRAGIDHLPYNVDLTFNDAIIGCARAFQVCKIDASGNAVTFRQIQARETAAHPCRAIFHKLRETLLSEFSAVGRNGWEIPELFRQVPDRAIQRIAPSF